MISKPQKRTWFSIARTTKWSTAGNSIPAMIPFALAHTVATEMCYYGLGESSAYNRAVLFLSGVFVSIFVTFPCMVALIRVQASLLSDDQETVVSFDSSFGVAGVTEAIDFQQAFKSVGYAGWKRIYWVAVKATGIMMGVSALICVAMMLCLALATSYVISAADTKESLTLVALISVLEFFGTLRGMS